MSEREYYTNSPYVNYCKWKGYEEAQDNQDIKLGTASYMIHRSLVSKPVSFKAYWPFQPEAGKKEAVTITMSKEKREEILRAHKMIK